MSYTAMLELMSDRRVRYPLDPTCPAVRRRNEETAHPGFRDAGDDALTRAFERIHRGACHRCFEYGLAHVQVGGE